MLRYTIAVDAGLGATRDSYRSALMRGTLSVRAYFLKICDRLVFVRLRYLESFVKRFFASSFVLAVVV